MEASEIEYRQTHIHMQTLHLSHKQHSSALANPIRRLRLALNPNLVTGMW